MYPIVAAQAQGASLWDVDGKEYIDFAGGIGVLNARMLVPLIREDARVSPVLEILGVVIKQVVQRHKKRKECIELLYFVVTSKQIMKGK
jgi:hypothetical protein